MSSNKQKMCAVQFWFENGWKKRKKYVAGIFRSWKLRLPGKKKGRVNTHPFH